MAKRKVKFGREARECFIAVLRETASPSQAAEAAGISRVWAYHTRARDPQFRADWDVAVDEALDQLVGEAFRRGVTGVEEPVVQGGKLVSVRDEETGEERPFCVRRFSDRLLEVLIKFRYPDRMAAKLHASVAVEGIGLTPEGLLRMSAGERKQLIALLSKYKGADDEADEH